MGFISLVQIWDPQEQLLAFFWDWGSKLRIVCEQTDFAQRNIQQIVHQHRRVFAAPMLNGRNVTFQVLRHCVAILLDDRWPKRQRQAGDMRQLRGGVRQTGQIVRAVHMEIMIMLRVAFHIFQIN